jgi:hypothetical protein
MSLPARAEFGVPAAGMPDDLVGGELEVRMIAAFSPPLTVVEVRRHLASAAAMFENARVRTYVALLMEKAAVDRLRRARQRREAGLDAANGHEQPPHPVHLHLVEKEAS